MDAMSTDDVKVALNALEYQQQLEADRDIWRAQTEALAEAATKACNWGCLSPLDRPPEDCDCAHHELGRALARLPADALAERRAVEEERDHCRSALVNLIAVLRKQWPGATMDNSHIPPSVRGAFRDACAALDATRGEGGA